MIINPFKEMVKLVTTNLLTNMVAKDFQGFSFFFFFSLFSKVLFKIGLGPTISMLMSKQGDDLGVL